VVKPVAAGLIVTVNDTPGRLLHDLTVVEVAAWMLEQDLEAGWITERELLRDELAEARDQEGRLRRGPGRRPDGVLVRANAIEEAIEVELTPKRDRREYDRKLAWYAGQLRCRDRGRHAGDDLDRDAGPLARDDLFHTAAEHERVPALEPYNDQALTRSTDQDRVDLVLGGEPPTRDLRDVDDLDTFTQAVQCCQGCQAVDDNDIGIGQGLKTLQCQQFRIPWAPADQNYLSGASSPGPALGT